MDSQNVEILKIIVGSAGFIGIGAGIIVMVFRTGKIVQKIEDLAKNFDLLDSKVDRLEENVDNRFRKLEENMNSRFKEVDDRFRRLEENFPSINIAITRLEVRLEERTLKTIDVPRKEASAIFPKPS